MSDESPISAGDLLYWPDSEEPEFGVVVSVDECEGQKYAWTFWSGLGDFSNESVRAQMPHEVWGSIMRVG